MIAPFTYEEGSILIRLLIAHFVADFFLQSSAGVQDKNRKGIKSIYLWKHVLIATALTWLLLGDVAYWKQVLLIGSTHLLIDMGKISTSKRYASNINKGRFHFWLFLVDQFLHIIIVLIAWLWIIKGWQKMDALLSSTWKDYRLFLRLLAYIIVIGPVSYLVRFLTDKWASDLEKAEVGLKDAGMWIGYLERTLILTFVFIEQYAAIGLLVTAKSLLRLIDKPDLKIDMNNTSVFNARKHTEYVLIGTFLSFTFALVTGLLIRWLLQL